MLNLAMNPVINTNLDLTRTAISLQLTSDGLDSMDSKCIEIKKDTDAIRVLNRGTETGLEKLRTDQVKSMRVAEDVKKDIQALSANDAAVRQQVRTWHSYRDFLPNMFNNIISSTCATVTPCVKTTCYVIAGCVVGTAIGGVAAFATNQNPGAGAAIGALAGLTVVGVALSVNKLCKQYFRCCSNNH